MMFRLRFGVAIAAILLAQPAHAQIFDDFFGAPQPALKPKAKKAKPVQKPAAVTQPAPVQQPAPGEPAKTAKKKSKKPEATAEKPADAPADIKKAKDKGRKPAETELAKPADPTKPATVEPLVAPAAPATGTARATPVEKPKEQPPATTAITAPATVAPKPEVAAPAAPLPAPAGAAPAATAPVAATPDPPPAPRAPDVAAVPVPPAAAPSTPSAAAPAPTAPVVPTTPVAPATAAAIAPPAPDLPPLAAPTPPIAPAPPAAATSTAEPETAGLAPTPSAASASAATPTPAAPPLPAAQQAAPAAPLPTETAAIAPPTAATPRPVAPAAAPAPPQAAVPAPSEPTRTAALEPPGLPPKPNPPNCRNSGNFPGWLAEFRKEAAAKGISQATLSDALDGMALDQGIINRDRGGQKVFTQSFIDFSSRLANPGRLRASIAKVNKDRSIFTRAEQEFGVPGPVIAAFWALESDFGGGMGNLPILKSLATLAYDCRRGEMFRHELYSALVLIDRGDMRPSEMIGSWAGEIGQTQFLPGHVVRYAIDYDGDGHKNLWNDDADIIGTTANFIRDLGWRAGEPWLQEVRVTRELPWQEADLAIKHPLTQWSEWGVTNADGSALDPSGPPASLVLPMGRKGPAFFAYPNFDVYTKWNQSLVYALTAAHLATRINGAGPMSRGAPGIPMLDAAQVKELQALLNRSGWDVGEPDGKLGAGTRAAVKKAQLKYKMPADSYPTPELLSALRGE